jgi:hypothetical protein
VGTADDVFKGGNIILGGGGSDIIEGRGGNDIIDGDAYLHVAIGIDADGDGEYEREVSSMRDVQAEMLDGRLNPGMLGIVREIRYAPSDNTDVDTAVFTNDRADYYIEGQDSLGGIQDLDGDGAIRVTQINGGISVGRAATDGWDMLRNIERIQFADQTITIVSNGNLEPVGLPIIDDMTPNEGQTISVNISGITDPNNTLSGGAITGPVSITWQQLDAEGDAWTDVMIGAVEAGQNGQQ